MPPPRSASGAAVEPDRGATGVPAAELMADALALQPVIERLRTLDAGGRRDTIDYLALRQTITDRVLLTLFEISSTIAEITCERDRTDQVADHLDERDATRVRHLTLASVILGGVGAIVSGGIGLASAPSMGADTANVVTGFFSTLFGGAALFTSTSQPFRHDRNLLKEVWEDPPRSTLYPDIVWRILHRRLNGRPRALRDEIVAAWRQQGRLGEPNSDEAKKREELFFGAGGAYTAADLRARASMLETLEASVRLMTEQLEGFVRDVLAERPPGAQPPAS
jgi:hypothetical protein